MRLREIAGRYGVARLAAEARIPDWANGPGFSAIVRADDELTVVCLEDRIPEGQTAQRGWACFRSLGPVPFDQAGVLSALIAPISGAGIGVFVLCTFDGEHILCPEAELARVKTILNREGHEFEPG